MPHAGFDEQPIERQQCERQKLDVLGLQVRHPGQRVRVESHQERFIEADTLAYLSRDGMYAYFDGQKEGHCDACFTGNYPVHFEDEGHTRQLHLFDAVDR